MAKNLKSNREIGCAMRRFKNFGYGEQPMKVKTAKHFMVMAVTRDRGTIPIRVNITSQANLSKLEGDFN